MKKFAFTLLFLLIAYVIYIDLSQGTLPSASGEKISVEISDEPSQGYFTYKAKAGDTVLSVLERQLDGQMPVSISTAVLDFKKLNSGINPEDIQIGSVYKFPEYSTSE